LSYLRLNLLLLVLIPLAGCQKEPEVQHYSVPKVVEAPEGAPKPSKVEAGPLIGGANAWFFKLMGSSDAVLKQAVPFTQVVRSLQFSEDGSPRFQVPEGWTTSSGPPPRYQTLKLEDSDPPLELTVSTLPVTGSDQSRYLQSNINRWREQVGLAPVEEENWLETMQAQGEVIIVPAQSRTVAMVNLNGETKETGATRMLAAIVIDAPLGVPQKPLPPVSKPVTYTAPEGWKETAGNSMRLASLEATGPKGKLDISVTRLGGGGDVLANVNRWRDQVSAPAITQEDLDKDATKMEISGQRATYIEAIGPEQGILAAIVVDGDAKWFFKAQGPVDTVEAERDRFKEFLKSAKLQTLSK
jgi:hypothetical protein